MDNSGNHKKTVLVLAPLFWPKMLPLGLGCLQAYAAHKGITVDIVDLNNKFYNLASEELKKSWLVSSNTRLENEMFDIISEDFATDFNRAIDELCEYEIAGFSCFKSNIKTTFKIINALKERKKHIKIALGGPEIARLYFMTHGKFSPELLETADLIVTGEGEIALVDFIKDKRNGVVNFLELKDLDGGSFPEYRGLDFSAYPRRSAAPIIFSRGCIRKCAFCSERLLYRSFRARSVVSLIKEISFLKDRGAKEFVFHDSMLNADLKRLEEFCDAVKSEFGSISWEAQMAVRSDMPDILFKKMKKSGCYHLFVGLESGSDATLGNMNKGYKTKDALIFFEKLKKAGLSFGVSMIVGFSGEKEADFEESVGFIIKNKSLIPKIEQVNPFVYYEGTKRLYDLEISDKDKSMRLEYFIKAMQDNDIKFTKAFVGNLAGKNG